MSGEERTVRYSTDTLQGREAVHNKQ